MASVLLEKLTWLEAEPFLNPEAIVMIPLGASAKEHGPHLPLNNDWLLADGLAGQVAAKIDLVIAPTVGYSFYPAFKEYPGSITLSQETAKQLIVEICLSLHAFGPVRFYVLNTGISTLKCLQPAALELAKAGILLGYTDLHAASAALPPGLISQTGGSHADEVETSMMLYLAPDVVDMRKAVKDFDGNGSGALTRNQSGKGVYSPTGIFGDATLATREKGQTIVKSLVASILSDIDTLRSAPLPTPA